MVFDLKGIERLRILHFADLHLGIESYGTVDPETGLSSRLADVLRVLDQLVDYALGNAVDLVIFCGDAYKTRDPSQTQQRELARRIRRLSDAGLPLLMVVGNHDLPNAPGRANTLEIFHTLAVSNVHVASKPQVHWIETHSGPLQVAVIPWLRRSGLLAREDARSLTIDQISARMQDVLTQTAASLANAVNCAVPAVLAAHLSVGSAKLGSERTMALGKEPVVLASNLALPQFDYVALGHIHRAQMLSASPPMAYSGSLERVDFGEEGDEKGFYVVDLEPSAHCGDRIQSISFQPVAARKFLTVRVKIDVASDDPTRDVKDVLTKLETDLKDAVVRVELDYPEVIEGRLRDADIRQVLKDAQNVSITKNVDRESRVRLGGNAGDELAPRRMLELYLETADASKLSGERRKLLLEYGERLIWEREANKRG
ncbi:MAG: exonuclease SbcCD subunit D [Dehalococcoidia bacterium]|nr:exonuclease SbcCD subunit D [Dehalococcoidia bacterium]